MWRTEHSFSPCFGSLVTNTNDKGILDLSILSPKKSVSIRILFPIDSLSYFWQGSLRWFFKEDFFIQRQFLMIHSYFPVFFIKNLRTGHTSPVLPVGKCCNTYSREGKTGCPLVRGIILKVSITPCLQAWQRRMSMFRVLSKTSRTVSLVFLAFTGAFSARLIFFSKYFFTLHDRNP